MFLGALSAVTSASAQIVLDHTMGPGRAPLPPPSGLDQTIPDSAGKTVGQNLFHSFSQFDLHEGESATFTGPAGIHNVLARVTERSPLRIDGRSTIDGTLNCAIDGANFFFINPFGVVFGQHAQVNVSGSFAVTTADYVKLDDGAGNVGRFDARNPANDVLISAPVTAFGFLGPTVAPITLAGVTEDQNNPSILTIVPDFKSIWLVGGNIVHEGFWQAAFGGEFVAVSVASAGELGVDVDNPRAEVDTTSFAALGTISVAHGAAVFVDGTPAGLAVYEADRINFSDHSGISVYTDGDTPAGGIIMRARSEIAMSDVSSGSSVAGTGRGGDIILTAPSIQLNNVSIGSITVADGDAGDVRITADDFALHFGGGISVDTAGAGAAGNLVLIANHVLIDGAARLEAFVAGGHTGSIDVQADTVELFGTGGISSDSFSGDFSGSGIHVSANTLTMDGTSISSRSRFDGSGGGNIVLDVAHTVVQNGATITATSENSAPAGSVTINGVDVIMDDSSIASAATADGAAGSVTLNLTGSFLLQNDGTLSVSAAGNDGGDINVFAGSDIRLINGQITAQAAGDGGNVHLTTPSLVYLLNSQITAESVNGNGGNVTIDPAFVILNHSLISANAIVGNGGNIDIVTDFFLSSDSQITASSEFGLQGSVTITAPNVDLSGNLADLETDLLAAEAQLGPHCATRLPGGVSSFVVLGSGGAPVTPDGLLPAVPTMSGAAQK